jgi:membrane protein DedA with SNARE-associated domain
VTNAGVRGGGASGTGARLRTPLLVLAAVRTILGIAAIPLAPALYRKHFVILVLMRPTKEVLLAGGFLLRRGKVDVVPMLAAAIPLAVLAVWLFYALGRAYEKELQSDDALPRWARRVLPPKRVKAMCRVLDKRGRPVVVIGRLAAFPSALMGAAAGASGMKPKAFLPADGVGALLSVAEVVGAGYAFGAAYKSAGPWLTGVGVAALLAILFLVGRWLRQEESGRGT